VKLHIDCVILKPRLLRIPVLESSPIPGSPGLTDFAPWSTAPKSNRESTPNSVRNRQRNLLDKSSATALQLSERATQYQNKSR